MKKLLAVAVIAVAMASAVSLGPPVQADQQQVSIYQLYPQSQATPAVYVAPAAESKLVLVSSSKDSIDIGTIAMGKRSSGADRRGKSEGATAMFVDRSRPAPLLL